MDLEVLSTAIDLDIYGGQEKVLMDVHKGLSIKYKTKVLGFVKFENVHPKYHLDPSEYVRFKNPLYLNDKILIVHGRNAMSIFMMLKAAFFLNTKLIYVHHNVYNSLKWASFFPGNIVSISEKVTKNLTDYFGLKKENIQLIYNGIRDEAKNKKSRSGSKPAKIKILYAARVNGVKRQLEIVDRLKNTLSSNVEIYFAGTGPDYDQLKDKCSATSNFYALGFVENTNELIAGADYLMLYSKQEGLPITLIEGAMHGKPLLINDVGGNVEIGVPGENGILLSDDWNVLATALNSLVNTSDEEYQRMSVNSRKRYELMFTYEKMISNYIKVIEHSQNN